MRKLERISMGMSLICAAHCALLPVLVGMLPLLGNPLEQAESLEGPMVAVAALLGYTTLGSSFCRHRRRSPLVLFSAGLLLMVLARVAFDHEVAEPVVMVGALTLAGAQLLNRRCPAACCADPAESHPTNP
jgi:hypothetical protein